MTNFDELIDEILFSLEAFYGYASETTKQYQDARKALTDAISAVTSERDKAQKERDDNYAKFLEEGRKFQDAVDGIVKLKVERDKWVELEKTRADLLLQTTGNRNIEMLAKDYNRLKADLNLITSCAQKYQPAGSPPPGGEVILVPWILRSLWDALIDAQQKCTMTEIHLSNELLHVDQLKEEQDKLEAKLAEANEDAERLFNMLELTNKHAMVHRIETESVKQFHRARLAKDKA